MAELIRSSAALVPAMSGANPPSSPRPVASPCFLSTDFSEWYTSAPQRSASLKDGAPIGATMNSWTSTPVSACAPPLTMFIIGTGRMCAFGSADVAEQRQPGGIGGRLGDGQRHPEDRVGAEPRLVRRCRRSRAAPGRPAAGRRRSARSTAGASSSSTRLHGLLDALAAVAGAAVAQLDGLVLTGRGAGRHRGARERAVVRATSTSTVGLPRESRISRAPTCSMMGTDVSLRVDGLSGRRSA